MHSYSPEEESLEMINQTDLINSSSTTRFSILFWFLSLFCLGEVHPGWTKQVCGSGFRYDVSMLLGAHAFFMSHPGPRLAHLEHSPQRRWQDSPCPFQLINPGVAGFFYTQFLDWNLIRSLLCHQWGMKVGRKKET